MGTWSPRLVAPCTPEAQKNLRGIGEGDSARGRGPGGRVTLQPRGDGLIGDAKTGVVGKPAAM